MSIVRLILAPMLAASLLVACDPVHSDAVNALPGSKVGNGPLHRSGQPCQLCHDGALGDPSAFSVAGTVFLNQTDLQGLDGVTVTLTDKNGSKYEAVTNAAGNFYVSPTQYTPNYPMHVAMDYQGMTQVMQTHVGRNGSCAGCHVDPVGPANAGHIYLIAAPDAGAR